MLNGIPVVASDRGGLPETVQSGGFVLPVCNEFENPDETKLLERWLDVIGKLHSDQAFYATAAGAAWDRAQPYRDGEVERERVKVFEDIAATNRHSPHVI
jgi:glycosyltransferase involved in cell wall biosynthesis